MHVALGCFKAGLSTYTIDSNDDQDFLLISVFKKPYIDSNNNVISPMYFQLSVLQLFLYFLFLPFLSVVIL